MSASHGTPAHHAGRSSRVRRRSRRRMFIFGGIVALAAAAGVGLAIYQSASGSTTKLPERVVTGEGRVLGDANAPETIVEYADFQCLVWRVGRTCR